MAHTTTFSGTVYGAFRHPTAADEMVKVMGCDDGSVVVAWGDALEHAQEGDEIFYAGQPDGENGYHTIIDPPDLAPAGEYIVESFFRTLPDSDWEVRRNGDVFAGLCHVGHVGDDGTLSLTRELEECGVSWRAMQAAMPEAAAAE
jgi:hypothetical protein